MFGSGSRDDEPADANIIAGLNSHPGREVDGLRRWRWTWCVRSELPLVLGSVLGLTPG